MDRIFKTSIMFAAVAFCAVSCSKWTEQQAVDFKYITLEEKNPALYNSYLASLRDFRESEHQVIIVRVDNRASIPVGRAEHLNSIPDSVDFVVLNNPSQISETHLAEIAELRAKKDQKFLAAISFAALDKAYGLYVEDLDPAAEPETEEVFIGRKVEEFLGYFTNAELDGILASYIGKSPAAMRQDEKDAVKSLQEAFLAPIYTRISSTGKTFFFEGNAKNLLVDEDVLGAARYIIVPLESETSAKSFDNAILNMLAEGVPDDKFIAGVTALDVTDSQAVNGFFSGETSAVTGAARWAVNPGPGVSKCGVCVNHAQFDYYHIGNDYREIRTAISIMNPSPYK